jgi:phthalate 4,5-dioxygenase
LQVFVPVDEDHTHFFYIRFSTRDPLNQLNLPAWSGLEPGKDVDENGFLRAAALPLWGQDRAAMAQGKSFTGLVGVNLQDIVVQESMGRHRGSHQRKPGASRFGHRSLSPPFAGDG